MNRIATRACRTTLFSLVSVAVVLIAAFLQTASAQQKDGDGVTAGSNSSSGGGAPSRAVNFNIIQLLNGEYLEMFGTGTNRGILRGHPTISGIELGTLSADPLLFTTNFIERMRITANGNVGLGTTTPGVALDVNQGRAIRVGSATLSSGGDDYLHLGNHSWFNGSQWQFDGVPGALYQMYGQHHAWWMHNGAGDFIHLMILNASGNLGIGTWSPSSRLHVDGGSIRLAQTKGETPFQLYSHSNSDSLWLTSGNTTKSEIHLSPSYAVDFDRSIALQYVPGTTGSAGGIMNVGQLSKNSAAWTHGVTAFYTNGAERLRINSVGRVGIGTPNPNFRLDVQGGAVNASGGLCMNGDCKTAWSQVGSQWTTSGADITFSAGNAGNVGIGGGPNPPSRLFVSGVGRYGTAIFAGTEMATYFNYNDDNTEDTHIRGGKWTSRVFINELGTGNVVIAQAGGNVGIGTNNPLVKLHVAGDGKFTGNVNASGGLCMNDGCKTAWSQVVGPSQWTTSGSNIYYNNANVGIGTDTPTAKLHVAGDGKFTGSLTVDGNIAAKYQDLAEWVPAAEQLSAGTVVVLDATQPNQVTSSSTSYDTRIAGVVSEQPGITLGEKSDNKVLVATTGRVRVRVAATNGPIQIGDLLVTSDKEGFAMKSLPVEIGGVRIHRPGTLIGKALEPLSSGRGEILVLLSLQ